MGHISVLSPTYSRYVIYFKIVWVKWYATYMPATHEKSRREEYTEATRQALLAAGRDIFASEGYQAAGVEAISRAARMTRGAFAASARFTISRAKSSVGMAPFCEALARLRMPGYTRT